MKRVLFRTIVLALILTFAVGPAWAATLALTASDRDGQGIEYLAVSLTPSDPSKLPSIQGSGEIVQFDKTFVPLVSIFQTGTAVSFPNRDTVRHHVYSFSPPKVFELKLYVGTPEQPVRFDRTGLVILGCNIHDHMVAYVLIRDTPWVGVTDARGHLEIDALPHGKYVLEWWHPRYLGRSDLIRAREIHISGDVSETLVLDLDV